MALMNARDHWVRREQKKISKDLEKPVWKLVEDENGVFVQKLIRHTHKWQPLESTGGYQN